MPSTRQLLGDLAEAELKHAAAAGEIEKQHVTAEVQPEEVGSRTGARLSSIHTARSGGFDGRLGIDSGARFCGRVCDSSEQGCVSWLDSRLPWAQAFRWVLRRRFPMTAR